MKPNGIWCLVYLNFDKLLNVHFFVASLSIHNYFAVLFHVSCHCDVCWLTLKTTMTTKWKSAMDTFSLTRCMGAHRICCKPRRPDNSDISRFSRPVVIVCSPWDWNDAIWCWCRETDTARLYYAAHWRRPAAVGLSLTRHSSPSRSDLQCMQWCTDYHTIHAAATFCLQCSDTVGWASGRASGLWVWGVGVVISSAGSEVQIVCIWSSWCHCHPQTPSSLASFIPDWFYLSGTGLPRLSWKRGHYTGVCVCVPCSSNINDKDCQELRYL